MKTRRRGGRGYYIKLEMGNGELVGHFFTPKKDTWDSLLDEISTFVKTKGYSGLIALEATHSGKKVIIDESNTEPIPEDFTIVKVFPYPFHYTLTFNGTPVYFEDRAYYEEDTTYVQLISELKRMYSSDDKFKAGLYLQVAHRSNPLHKIKYTNQSPEDVIQNRDKIEIIIPGLDPIEAQMKIKGSEFNRLVLDQKNQWDRRFFKGGRKTCKHKSTYIGLHQWFKSEYEKLGWMVLAKSKGMHEKVRAYVHSVQRLHDHLECKIQETMDKDRLDDLTIMLQDVKILLAHCKHDFNIKK